MTETELCKEYFENCVEDNNFDKELITDICEKYNISEDYLKNIILLHRQEYITKFG